MTKSWTIEIQEDPETGDLIMPIPADLLESQGWVTGDVLTWDKDLESDCWTLTKK
jgi:hypothetical protein